MKKNKKILDIGYLILFLLIFFIGGGQAVQAASSPEGGSCWIDDQCLTGLYCQQEESTEPGKCFKKKTYGAVCGTNHECQSNQCTAFHCLGESQEMAKGCMTDAGCDPGYHCKGAVPAGAGQFAQGTPGECVAGPPAGEKIKWQPIAPTLQINIPTLQPFTTAGMTKTDEEGNIYIPFIGQYIAGIYRWLILIAGLVAAVMVIIGGFIYLTSGGNAQRTQQGKDQISHALLGLLLLLGSYLLLYTINPDLVSFESLKVKVIERVEFGTFDKGPSPTPLHPKALNFTGYDEMFKKYGTCLPVDWQALKAMAYIESAFDAEVVNQLGFTGLFQTKKHFCEGTLKRYGFQDRCSNLTDPETSTMVGTGMMKTALSIIKNHCPNIDFDSFYYFVYLGHHSGSGALANVIKKGCVPSYDNLYQFWQTTSQGKYADGSGKKWTATNIATEGHKGAMKMVGLVKGMGVSTTWLAPDPAKCPFGNKSLVTPPKPDAPPPSPDAHGTCDGASATDEISCLDVGGNWIIY